MNIKQLAQVILLKSQFPVVLPLFFISALLWFISSLYGLAETIDIGGALKNTFKPPAKNLTSKNKLPIYFQPISIEMHNEKEFTSLIKNYVGKV